MSDQFQETTTRSWGTRLKETLGGIIFGLLALFLMPWLLFWNEGRAVQTAKSLAEGAGIVRGVPVDQVDAANEGALVHVSGQLVVTDALVDTVTGLRVVAVRLKRTAEMYQWIETCQSKTERKLGGSEETVTTCTYSKGWKEGRVASESFRQPAGHENPPAKYTSGQVSQSTGTLGAFSADQRVMDRLSGEEPLELTGDMMATVRATLSSGGSATAQGNTIYPDGQETPRVGDERLIMTHVSAGPVSVVGQQTQAGAATQFAPYQTEAGDALLLVDRGIVSAASMFKQAQEANVVVTWLLRLIGLVFLFAGLSFMLRPLAVLADVVPMLGTVVRFGTGTVAGIAALLIGGATIGIAWIWYRPLIGIAVIAGAAILALFLWKRGSSAAAVRGEAI